MSSLPDKPEVTRQSRPFDPALHALLRAEILALKEEVRQRDAEVVALRQPLAAQRSRPYHRLRNVLTSLRRQSMLLRHGLSFRRQVAAVEGSEFFDADWYTARYPICGGAPTAAIHYLRSGAFEGLDPGPDFDTSAYLRANPDVAAARMPALAHYLLHGRAEGRRLRPAGPAAEDGASGS